MKRPSGAELRIRRQANKTFVLPHMDEPARGGPLPHCLYKKNPFRRRTTPPRWIAAVSAAEEILAAKNAKYAKKWKAVTERPSGAQLRLGEPECVGPPENVSRGDAETRRMFAKF